MSNRGWLHKPTVRRSIGVGLAFGAALVISWSLWPAAPAVVSSQQIESFQEFFEGIDPACFATLAKRDELPVIPQEVEGCADKEAAHKKDYRNLTQSIRSANAAEEAAWLSYLQTRASIVGAALILLTLGATAWAAWAAADAATIADKSAAAAIKAADIAEDAVAVARETAERQLRAYIFLSASEAKPPKFNGSDLRLWLTAVNTGQTPAYKLMVLARVGVFAHPFAGPFPKRTEKSKNPSRTDLGPHREYPIPIRHTGITPEEKLALETQRARLYIWGALYYQDAFKKRRVTRFQMSAPVLPERRIPGIEFSPKGNEAT